MRLLLVFAIRRDVFKSESLHEHPYERFDAEAGRWIGVQGFELRDALKKDGVERMIALIDDGATCVVGGRLYRKFRRTLPGAAR